MPYLINDEIDAYIYRAASKKEKRLFHSCRTPGATTALSVTVLSSLNTAIMNIYVCRPTVCSNAQKTIPLTDE